MALKDSWYLAVRFASTLVVLSNVMVQVILQVQPEFTGLSTSDQA